MKDNRVAFALIASTFLLIAGCGSGASEDGDVASVEGEVNSHWYWCNGHPGGGPGIYYSSLHAAATHTGGMASNEQECMSKIACYESTWRPGAVNGIYHGLYQMSSGLFPRAGVTWSDYLNGGNGHDVWFEQDVAGISYARSRYGSPCAGWQHEHDYGWW
jgi:hypothetical protein